MVVATGGSRWAGRRTRIWLLVDGLLAVFSGYAAVALTAELVAGVPGSMAAAAYVLAAAHGASVTLRRLAPVVAVVGLLSTAAGYAWVGLPVFMLGPAVLFVANGVGVALALRPAALLLGVLELALVLLLRLGPGSTGWASVLLFGGLAAGAWFVGFFARRWQVLAAENAQRARDLEAAREELARHAVAAERIRIARELHDMVAHSMSVIAMHAGAARLAVGSDPVSERAALEVIERSSREALAEMRRLVGVLRDEDADAVDRQPVPNLDQLPTLVAAVAAGGGRVDVHLEGDLATAPPSVSVAAYRIIQEALTNVVRHAAQSTVHVLVRARPDEVTVRVENDAPADPGTQAPVSGGGHGTVGMRERVELYGGTLQAGPTAQGGWLIEARLPFVTVGP